MYNEKGTSLEEDAKFLLNMTDHMLKSTEEQKRTFFGLLDNALNRAERLNSNIEIPRDRKSGNQILLEGSSSVMGNIPCPSTEIVDGHVCIRIKDVLAHHLAHARGIDWTSFPDKATGDRIEREHGIHGSPAMKELLKTLRLVDDHGEVTHIGWYVLWSDGFLRSWIRQKHNNVWILTLTFPDPDGSSTSRFHTYCVAIGRGSQDHTPVINWLARQIKELAEGDYYYCGADKGYKRVKMGLIAYLADRPERASLFKTMLLGTYGLRSGWAAEIDLKHLPDCRQCFAKRIKNVLLEKYNIRDPRRTCNKCCAWNMESTSSANAKMTAPELYPELCHQNSPPQPFGRRVGARIIVPVRQSMEWLRSVYKFALFNVKKRSGIWVYWKLICVRVQYQNRSFD